MTDRSLDCLSSMATRRILADLATLFRSASGLPVEVRSMGGVDAARLVREGAACDVVVLAAPVMQALEAEGRLVPGSRVDMARSLTALAVRLGTARPSLATGDDLRRVVEEAPSIGYSTGPSGDHFIALLRSWGIFDAVEARLLKAPPGVPVGTLVADGRAAIGIQQVSELVDLPGIDIVGPLPPDVQAPTIFTAGVAVASADPAAAGNFAGYLGSAAAHDVIARHGMGPARG